jgi:DNA-binding PadR family transcriptional regulator
VTAVFSHGRLRLYLLKLLAEGPRHGYELIRLLENRFLGLYAPSAGTIYPRLQRLEVEGLVTHTAAGGRKVYEITDGGRAELAARAGELAELEGEIHASVADLTTLASEIEHQVSGSVRDIKRELRDAAREARTSARDGWTAARSGWAPPRPGPGTAPVAPSARRPAGGATRAGVGEAGVGDAGVGEVGVGELERAAGELADEVRRLARRTGLTEPELRAATAVVTSALTELRRLLHG